MINYNKNFALPNEIWEDVRGYEGLYKVSTMGRVKSLNYNHTGKERILRPVKTKKGYLRIGLHKNGKTTYYFIHRLVAEAFLKPNDDPEHKTQVNHIREFEKDFNHYGNLSWVTPKENINYGTCIQRRVEKQSKAVYQYTLNGQLVKKWSSANEIERQTRYSQGHICNCCNGKRKNVYGFKWSYEKPQDL